MADVLGLTLNADVVALSACNTGAGPHSAGDGISGFTRAFLFAGTRTVSVTLWTVDDAAAPLLTPVFFQALYAGASPGAAMRKAKLGMLAFSAARFRHPYAWAPAVLFGDAGIRQ
jgi:CHAT domain-containing protein